MPNRKILIVDDEEFILNLLRSGLTENGFEVVTAHNGFEAILAVEEQKPDMVITDIMMPRLTGLDFLKALKNNKDTRNLPVMLISARDEAELVQKGLALGAIDYITKPFKINEIIGKLRHQLS
jgi:two-component system alkaline phosphatase synthesis response regulator PhoP